jgi:hypothetical protein
VQVSALPHTPSGRPRIVRRTKCTQRDSRSVAVLRISGPLRRFSPAVARAVARRAAVAHGLCLDLFRAAGRTDVRALHRMRGAEGCVHDLARVALRHDG